MPDKKIVIAGAGPAGLGCAYTLAKANQPCLVIAREDTPGGLCRSINFSGCLFDIGGHRFLSKSAEVNALWQGLLGGDLLRVKRMSRIYYRKKYFRYPLSLSNALISLGPRESISCFKSYLISKFAKTADDTTFQGWMVNRFGRRFYDIFFKSYTEKVWGMPCEKISADWAVQRIRGLSLRGAISQALGRNGRAEKTLYKEFFYPRYGSGEFYQKLKDAAGADGARFSFEKTIKSIRHCGGKITGLELRNNEENHPRDLALDHFFSSIPITSLIKMLEPAASPRVQAYARQLNFRSLIAVNVILNKGRLFPGQWIYVHSPEVRLARVQNYKNWSPEMVKSADMTSLGLEYFCNENDALWGMKDSDLINYALEELEKIGIGRKQDLANGFVVRCPDAYPVYSLGYQEYLKGVKDYLSSFSNLTLIGRAGLFRYDNSDHALLTGIYAGRNFLGTGKYDLWQVNADKQYLES